MEVTFGKEHLETLSPRFIIDFAGFLHNRDISRISITCVESVPVDELNAHTIIRFSTITNSKFELHVRHSKSMSCSNWDLTNITNKSITINNKPKGTIVKSLKS